MSESNEKQACCERRYEISPSDLPLSCPGEQMRVWDAHPKVYLPIEKSGRAVCPYCGAEYVFKK